MQISEQNKQEAEKVVIKYGLLMIEYIPLSFKKKATQCAIQDRQSVLEALEKVKDFIAYPSGKVGYEITNLTEQIEYLKSKL